MIYIVSPFENDVESRGTRNIALYHALKKSCLDVQIITTNFSHQRKTNISTMMFSDLINYKVFKVPAYRKNLSLKRFLTHQVFALKIYFYLRGRLREGDTVLISSIPPESVFVVSLLKRSLDFNFVLDVRDIWPNALPLKGFKMCFFKLYCNLFYSGVEKHIDHVTYVSPSFKTKWIENYAPNTRSTFVPLGFDSERWSVVDKDVRLLGRVGSIKIVYVGYLQSQFPLDVFIKAISNFKCIELHVIGDGEYLNDYKRMSSSNVFFYGSQPPEITAGLVSKCSVGLLPISGNAQMPNKLFDYLGAQIPILCLGASDSSEFVKKEGVGWTVDFDVEEIQRFLSQLSENNIMNKSASLMTCRKGFTKEILYEKMVGILKG